MSSTFSRPAFAAFLLMLASLPAHAQSADDLMKRAAIHDQNLNATEALKVYLAAEKLDPKNVRILVAIARQYRHLMADAKSKDEKLRLGRLGLDYGRASAALAPNDSEAQLSTAITYGKMLPFLGAKEQVDASPRIKIAVDKALALDPRNDTAWHILGRWNRVLADMSSVKRALAGVIYGNLPKGSNGDAAQALEKAVALDPTRLMHFIELGRVYAQMERNDDARRMINKGLAMPSVEKDDPDMKMYGRETLKKLR